MDSYGARVVYVVDSAGALVRGSAAARVQALREALPADVAVGFHAHNNLGCGVGNALAAVEAGATWLDGSLRGLGAGAGNAAAGGARGGAGARRPRDERGPVPADGRRRGRRRAAHAAGADHRPHRADASATPASTRSFLLHAERAGAKFGVEPRAVLIELGRRRIVGGQEDMIIDVAAELARGRAAAFLSDGLGPGIASRHAAHPLRLRLGRAHARRCCAKRAELKPPSRLAVGTTVAARAVQHDVVVVDGEAERAGDALDRLLQRRIRERLDLAAAVADEVMVVIAVGQVALVARDRPGRRRSAARAAARSAARGSGRRSRGRRCGPARAAGRRSPARSTRSPARSSSSTTALRAPPRR